MSNYQLFHNDLPSKILKSFKGDISIDTETLGLNIKRDRLCLIQLRNETDKKVYLIKFEEDLSPKLSKNTLGFGSFWTLGFSSATSNNSFFTISGSSL